MIETMEVQGMAAIFISHANLDRQAADDLAKLLKEIGFRDIFLDYDDRQGIPLGSDWERRLYYEIERCHALIVVLTKNWLNSKWCFVEFAQARALGKRIYVILENPSIERGIIARDLQVCDFVKDRRAGVRRLHDELSRSLLVAQSGFPFDEDRRFPFPGFNAFEEQDAGVFFGRDNEINGAIEKVRSGSRLSKKTLLLIGGSGTGKSSLLKAGMIPRLRRERDVDGNQVFLVALMRPGSHPLESVLTALRALDPSLGPDDLADVAGSVEARRLIERLRARAGASAAILVLAIDQAEEMFAAGPELAPFVQFLLRLLDEDNPVKLVCSMRTDHLEAAQKLADFARSFDHFPVQPLSLDLLEDVISGPAKRVDMTVDHKLVDAIRVDAATDDAMPLVAFVLNRLYGTFSRQSRRLELAHYRSLGQGDLTPLEAIVRKVADDAVENSTGAEMDALRSAFIPGMARIDERLGVFTRKEALIEDLPFDARRTMGNLVDARLLVLRATLKGTTIEVAHEALFRVWPTLAAWLEADRDLLARFQGLQGAAREWAVNDRFDAWLVHRGARLADAEKIAARRDISCRFETDDRDYLDACRSRERKERGEREAAESKIEAGRRKELADAKLLAAAEGQKRRSVTIGLAVAAILTLATSLAAIVAWQQRGAATQQASEARSATHIANSKTELQAGKIRRAIAEAKIAYDLYPDPSSRSALLSSMLALSPELDAVLNLRSLKPKAVEWVDRTTIAIGTTDGRIVLLRAEPGSLPFQSTVLQAPASFFKDGERQAIVAVRRLPSGDLLAVYQNGLASLLPLSGEASRPWSIAASKAGVELEFETPPSISEDGSVFAYTSPVESKVVVCSTTGEKADCNALKPFPKANVSGISAKKRWAFFGFPDGSVSLCDLLTGVRQTVQIGGPGQSVRGIAATPDERGLIVWTGGPDYVLLETDDPSSRHSFKTGHGLAPGIDFRSVNGAPEVVEVCRSETALATDLCFLRIETDPGSGTLTPTDGSVLKGPTNTITAITISDKGSEVATLDSDDFLHVWRRPAKLPTHRVLPKTPEQSWLALPMGGDRNTATAVAAEGDAVVLGSAGARHFHGSGLESKERAVAAARSDNMTFIASDFGNLMMKPDMGEASTVSVGVEIAERGLAWTGRGKELLLITTDGQVASVDLEKAPEPSFLDFDHGIAQGLAVSAGARRAFVQFDRNARIAIVDLDTNREVGLLPDAVGCSGQDLSGAGSDLEVSPDGRWLAATTKGNAVRLYDLTGSEAPKCLEAKASGEAEGVSFASDSRRLATIDVNDSVAVWNIGGAVESIRFSLPATAAKGKYSAAQIHQSLAWLNDGVLVALCSGPDIHFVNLDEKAWHRKVESLDISAQ